MPEPIDLIPWGVKTIRANGPKYCLYQKYFDGDHRLVFASEKFRNAFGSLFQAFALNMCPSIVEAISDRMEIEAWDGTGAEQAQAAFDAASLDLTSVHIHEEGLTKGDVVVICEQDTDGTPRAYVQDSENVAVRYDPNRPGTVEAVVKVWQTGMNPENSRAIWRLNIYTDLGCERYVTRNAVATLPDEADGWAEWTEDGPSLTAAPVAGVIQAFHYGNRAKVGRLGRSELQDVVPVQDWLNKTVADLMVGMEYTALPQRWATGLEVDEDPDVVGRPIGPEPFGGGTDRIWANANDAGGFGQFQGADLTQFLEVIKEAKQSVAQVSGTPVHYLALSGEFPSGESLKTAEARLVKKVLRRQKSYGARHAALVTYLAAMSGATLGDDLQPIWDSAETRDDRLEAETQEIKQRIGVSKPQSLREMGYTDEEITEMENEKQTEADQQAKASLAAFDRAVPVSGAQAKALANPKGGF